MRMRQACRDRKRRTLGGRHVTAEDVGEKAEKFVGHKVTLAEVGG
jgi:hypothetical protein